jgi:hypothetical protein
MRSILGLQRVDDAKRAPRESGQLCGVDLVRRRVLHVLAMVILASVVVNLVKLVVKGLRWMCRAARSNFPDHLAQPFVRAEARRIRRPAEGFEHHPHLANNVDHGAGAIGDVGLKVVDIGRGAALRRLIEVHDGNLRAERPMISDAHAHAVGRRRLVPKLFQERRVVRQHDRLQAALGGLHDFVHRLPATERILAIERVVEHNDGVGRRWIALKVGEEERERERRAIPRAERILEAGLIDRGFAVADIYRHIVDQ